MGSPYGTNIGAHMGPIWDPLILLAGEHQLKSLAYGQGLGFSLSRLKFKVVWLDFKNLIDTSNHKECIYNIIAVRLWALRLQAFFQK